MNCNVKKKYYNDETIEEVDANAYFFKVGFISLKRLKVNTLTFSKQKYLNAGVKNDF